MKKLIYIATFAAAMLLCMFSCSNDDVPEARLDITLDGAKVENGAIEVSQNSQFSVKSVTLDPQYTTPGAMIVKATYYWDGNMIGETAVYPFSWNFNVQNASLGNHTLTINTIVVAEGMSVGYYAQEYPVVITPFVPENQTEN